MSWKKLDYRALIFKMSPNNLPTPRLQAVKNIQD